MTSIIEITFQQKVESVMPDRIELGTIGFQVEVKNGDVVLGSQQFEVLQNNMKEVGPLVPDAKYQWVLSLDLEKAEKQ